MITTLGRFQVCLVPVQVLASSVIHPQDTMVEDEEAIAVFRFALGSHIKVGKVRFGIISKPVTPTFDQIDVHALSSRSRYSLDLATGKGSDVATWAFLD